MNAVTGTKMTNGKQRKMFLTLCDIAAWIAVFYPFLLLTWGLLSDYNGPATPLGVLEALCMFLFIPGILWLNARYNAAPKGTYPLGDRFASDPKFRRRVSLAIILAP